jgi:capsular exopolysaccharide synthesis family protein
VFRPGTLGTNYAEMYRILRASISLLGDEKRRKVTLFTSALPGEGKTATSVNFALAAACQKRRTLLIDCDLRKPAVHKLFGRAREAGAGITDVLAKQTPIEQTIQSDFPEPDLHVIFSGSRAPNPGELLDTGRLQAVLDWAVDRYDVVVLDTAPLLAVPDTRILAPLVDNLCLVVRGQFVPKGAVRRTLEVLAEDGTEISGVVFNGFKEKKRLIGQNYSYGQYRRGSYGYRYGYGSYGSYGSYGADEEDEAPKSRKRVGNRKRRKGKPSPSA